MFDLLNQAFKNEDMKGQEQVPVEFAPEAFGLIMRFHRQAVPVAAILNPELKPRPTGQFHLGTQKKPFVNPIVLDAPEIDHIVNSQA